MVIIFILATSGLLTWAVFRPWISGWIEVCFTSKKGKKKVVLADVVNGRL